jgi:hypothetical protein
MPDTLDVSKMNDHELLLVLHTKFDNVVVDIRDLKDGTTKRIADLEAKTDQLETYKASKVDLEKTDLRLDRVRTTQNLITGGLIIINALLPFIYHYLFK